MFLHHPDGRIHIGGAVLPLAEFLIDEPGYALPAGATGRSYDPAAGHHILSDGANQWGGPVPWAEGDGYLANGAAYAANFAARIAPPPPTLAETRAEAAARVDRRAESVRGRWITHGSGQALAYEAKRREAVAWAAEIAAAATPGHANYPWMLGRAARLNAVAEASVTQPQMQAVADEWAAKAAVWIAAGITIEAVREGAKEDIEAAADAAAVDAVVSGLAWPAPV